MSLFPIHASCFPLRGHAAPAPRLLLRSFLLLLSSFLFLCISPARADSTLYIKPDDNQVRATERLSDFLETLGYTVEYRDEEKDSLIVHQQQHRIHATLVLGENELPILTLAIHYKFKPKAGTPEGRALVANAINNRQYGIKACVDEKSNDLYFEFALPFDNYLQPRTMKRFADQAVATTYIMVSSDKAINSTFFSDEDSPDSARNADETDDDKTVDDADDAMTDEASDDAKAEPSDKAPSAKPTAGESDDDRDTTATPSSPSAPSAPPAPPSPGATVTPTPGATVPPSSSQSEPPSPGATVTPSASPSLVPSLPPTTPAAPARTKKARA